MQHGSTVATSGLWIDFRTGDGCYGCKYMVPETGPQDTPVDVDAVVEDALVKTSKITQDGPIAGCIYTPRVLSNYLQIPRFYLEPQFRPAFVHAQKRDPGRPVFRDQKEHKR